MLLTTYPINFMESSFVAKKRTRSTALGAVRSGSFFCTVRVLNKV